MTQKKHIETIATKDFLLEQLKSWELAHRNYSALRTVRIKSFQIEGHEIAVQFNPSRITSSAAKVDPKSIAKRPCFLCRANRPMEQQEMDLPHDMTFLINPFPIFPEHFTICSKLHQQQELAPNFNKLLKIASLLPEHVVFYNGPKCGASAPDHFHFQAGNRNFLPIEKNLANGLGTCLYETSQVRLLAKNDGLRRYYLLEGNNPKALTDLFEILYQQLTPFLESIPEPPVNVLCWYQGDNSWQTILLPRENHRPHYFFLEDPERILLSPASVDLGGVCIVPRQEDFEKITPQILKEIFHQVGFSKMHFESLNKELQDQLR